MNGCTRLAFFICLSWRADESYPERNSRKVLKSFKLIILFPFSGNFKMHLSRNLCSWCNDQQQSLRVYVLPNLFCFETCWHNVVEALWLAKVFMQTVDNAYMKKFVLFSAI